MDERGVEGRTSKTVESQQTRIGVSDVSQLVDS